MLRLERMEIAGFKSFSDRIEARFPDGITAVVGPNGCGKSNLGDAINWVLGEQSPKNLRGKQMTDVIFSGSERRKPKGMAEVSLFLVNDRPELAPEDRKVVITRRLFRTGESEYLLDGRRCRLKDIQEVLRAERVGAKTYATIEQGRIDQILNAKPKERRLIIEDAAGVSGFKHKRRLAELKLEATHANLLRVQDVVGEVTRQINSLKRQAAKARRYQRLRDELRDAERLRFGAREREVLARLQGLRASEAAARDRESRAAAVISGVEARIAADRQALEAALVEQREASERLHALELEIDREQARCAASRERIEEATRTVERAEAELGALDLRAAELQAAEANQSSALATSGERVEQLRARCGEGQVALEAVDRERTGLRVALDEARRAMFRALGDLAERRNERRALEEALERNSAERERLASEGAATRVDRERLAEAAAGLGTEATDHEARLEALRTAAAEAERRVIEARAALEEHRGRLAVAREREHAAQSRLATLQDVATRFAGVSDGVRMLLTAGRQRGLRAHGVVADFVEAGREIEGIADGYLQGLLPAVILEDGEDARRAVDLLASEGAGRTTFVCRSQPAGGVAVGAPLAVGDAVPDVVMSDPRVRGRLRDRLTLNTQMNGVVQDRIGDAVVVDSLETALELHRVHPFIDYLSERGEVVYASGLVAAGGASGDRHGLLAHNRRVHDARIARDFAMQEVAGLDRDLEALRDDSARREAESAELRTALEVLGRRAVELSLRAERSRDEHEQAARRGAVLDAELENRVAEAEGLAAEVVQIAEAVAAGEAAEAAVRSAIERDTSRLEALDARAREIGESLAGARAELAAAGEQHDQAVREVRRLHDAWNETCSRIAGVRRDAAESGERAREAAQLLASTEASLAAHRADQDLRREALLDTARQIDDRRAALADCEHEAVEGRRELDQARDAVRTMEIECARAEADRLHLDEFCRREIGIGAEQAAAESAERLDSPDFDLATCEREVEEVRGRIDALGPVNMTAIEEFAELEQRHAFLTSQKDDLERSIASLRDTIRKINAESRDRFVEAFEGIRANYQEIFQVLFNGGRADLRLEEGEDDILEAGIEILAQPPGKRLSGIQLLSGGEKAMSAIALLFAIFRYQPSPFCLLDEVDAPLDDSNVGRFTRMLREYASQTQFIMITHNKVSMESANLLYGVTMEEPGVSRLVSLQLH